MNYAQYLRDRAAEFANIALTTADAWAARNFHDLATLCDESAARLERHQDKEQALSRLLHPEQPTSGALRDQRGAASNAMGDGI